ncbi:TIGR03936 family radical SAM-associated protein [Terracoccus luteus]|jgi:radical SAM-linked protein|uniref:Radical SAM-linked protein n=1 Tax=Terracoccus luteus TaxID=53356 RepID=A0A495XU61_9MICO|nr:TIGR03936 family radical SAM-associated protein [Terracoccus luteus]MBB2987019.1 radical SAM-linked protein [Terracoccus luteus]MCP2172670.1 radical SAM-linked protein [Terracoccus luteus]RKT77069.1 radical SAM-linked protein [Terracoccus luteus]
MARQARQRVPEGPAPDPAVQKLRIRYTKRGRLRFTSSRDFQRALERALRRADVPMAFSAGFHPHPKISYANAAATGTASEAEYVEISVTRRVDPESVRVALDEALPDGIDIEEVVEAAPGALADRLEASAWHLEFQGVDSTTLTDAVERLLALERADVTRMTKSGPRTFDVRGAVVSTSVTAPAEGEALSTGAASLVASGGDCAILRMVVRHTTPAVRPDDILTALREIADLQPPRPPLVTRLAQGPLDTASARVADPLAADENAAGTEHGAAPSANRAQL